MSNQTQILFLGGAGYIGGTVLDAILKHPKVSEFTITAYIRSAETAEKLKALGVNAVSGPSSIVEDLAANSNVVINCASSDDAAFVETILAGAKKAYNRTHVQPVIIHTSGTAIISDKAMGQYAEKIYDDVADEAVLAAIPATARHRAGDIRLAAAHGEGYVKAYVIIPPLIYGLATGRFVDAGIQNPVTTSVMFLDAIRQKRGLFGRIGPGKNVYATVEVHDVARLYLTMLDAALERKQIAGGSAYYTAVDGEVTLGDFTQAVASELHNAGVTDTEEVTEVTAEEAKKWPMLAMLGDNVRVSDTRSRSLGWKPTHKQGDFLIKIRESAQFYATSGMYKQNKFVGWVA
ncbi:hypothetical protein EIP91_000243 [Steccherinum ochraceum]|uniref:Uncharacterized protein n=1 Tax=Steccherinum ochraceum TaxID=92696 RepID=A0A4R0RJL7_9APHY|nr:hypothetical protein EIP91_000243 [Steccherinum ochraceum]